MERIRKALALGLHQGGNSAEKQHAMQRATRLMQQYGVTHAGAALLLLPILCVVSIDMWAPCALVSVVLAAWACTPLCGQLWSLHNVFSRGTAWLGLDLLQRLFRRIHVTRQAKKWHLE
jgi:hypothetical protein